MNSVEMRWSRDVKVSKPATPVVRRRPALLIVPLVLLSLLYFSPTLHVIKERPSTPAVMDHLRNLEALTNVTGSRSVATGHSASVAYVLEVLGGMTETFSVSTEDVSVDVQVDEVPPFMAVTSR